MASLKRPAPAYALQSFLYASLFQPVLRAQLLHPTQHCPYLRVICMGTLLGEIIQLKKHFFRRHFHIFLVGGTQAIGADQTKIRIAIGLIGSPCIGRREFFPRLLSSLLQSLS